MFDDIRKSLSAALYERTTSPLYGSLIITWSLWNWPILYLLFWDETKMDFAEKLDCVRTDLYNPYTFWVCPFVSTVIILLVGNLLANAAYWLQLQFDNWKTKQKEQTESGRRLTIDESIMLRKEINGQQEFFQKSINDKDVEISLLKKQLSETLKGNEPEIPSIEDIVDSGNPSKNYSKLSTEKNDSLTIVKVAELASNVPNFGDNYKKLMLLIRNKEYIHSSLKGDESRFIPLQLLEILENYNIIDMYDQGHYKFTALGKAFNRYFLENFKDKD